MATGIDQADAKKDKNKKKDKRGDKNTQVNVGGRAATAVTATAAMAAISNRMAATAAKAAMQVTLSVPAEAAMQCNSGQNGGASKQQRPEWRLRRKRRR